MIFKDSCRGKNLGLLILRVGIGIIFILHGYPKLLGGMAKWAWLGSKMSLLGITFMPAFWGFVAGASECVGGALLVVGFITRIAAFFMAGVMFVACYMHLSQGDGFSGAAHALSMLAVFVSIVFSGAGEYSLDQRFSSR